MKQAISIVLAFLIIITVVYTIPNNKEFDIKYIANCFATISTKEVPSLTGGYSFTDGFSDASLATVYLVSYPIRFVYYLISQTVWLFGMLFGIQEPLYNGARPGGGNNSGGFGGGVYS